MLSQEHLMYLETTIFLSNHTRRRVEDFIEE